MSTYPPTYVYLPMSTYPPTYVYLPLSIPIYLSQYISIYSHQTHEPVSVLFIHKNKTVTLNHEQRCSLIDKRHVDWFLTLFFSLYWKDEE